MSDKNTRIKRNTKIRWTSRGPQGERKREGVVKAFVPKGQDIKLPKSADPAKFKATVRNKIHDRYLIEVPRVNAKTGQKLASHWLAPKAAFLESKKESRLRIVS